jgi:hypothetical protein
MVRKNREKQRGGKVGKRSRRKYISEESISRIYARERNENLPCIRLSAFAILLGTAERQETKNSRIKKRLLVEVVLGLLNPGSVVIVESSPERKYISARSGGEQRKLLTRCY